MINSLVWKRYEELAKKKSQIVLKGLHFTAIQGRFWGPKVLINSIPKSGTNLLESALSAFPFLRGTFSGSLMPGRDKLQVNINSISKIKRGQVRTAHLGYSEKIFNVISENGIKQIFLIRDPRDVAVSIYKYVLSKDVTHSTSRFIVSLATDDDRLMAVIKGVNGIFVPIADVYANFSQWLRCESCHIVRFEDLVGGDGGGTLALQRNCIEGISNYLGIDLSERDISDICLKQMKKKTPTYRKGKIGGWRDYFKDSHKKAFEKSIGKYMQLYGYSFGPDW